MFTIHFKLISFTFEFIAVSAKSIQNPLAGALNKHKNIQYYYPIYKFLKQDKITREALHKE